VHVILGDLGVVLAVAASLVGMIVLLVGIRQRSEEILRLGARFTWVVLGGSVFAFAILERALFANDFSVAYVASHGSTTTPGLLKFATAWGALEGSILLWGVILGIYLVVVTVKFQSRLSDPLVSWALVTMFGVCVFFFGLMAGPADPFQRVAEPPLQGGGLNPLLADNLLMAFHPPMLYAGYVGFTVPFAFAIAALVTGRVGEGWLIETRRWSLVAWGFLTLGIVLGAWWAYDITGWGGYWGWDPVENASLLPWLTGTAYIHSVMVQERRGMLRVWNISLLCATFALTILGTFITRSGVIASVHAFSVSSIGPMLLGFFAFIVALTVGLIGWRGERLRSPGQIDSPISREGSFLANNLLFAVFAFVVLLGTVFPLIVEAFNGNRIAVGTPYFERMTMPIGMLLLFLMAVAPVLPWRKAGTELLRHRLQWPAWMGVGALVLSVLVGARGFFPLVAFGLAGFAAGAALRQVFLATRRNGLRGLVGRTNGGMIVHLGVILIAVAFAASNSYVRQAEFALVEGDVISFADHELRFIGLEDEVRTDKSITRAVIEVDGDQLNPSINRFPNGGQTEKPSTRSSFTENVQLSLVKLADSRSDTTVVKVTVQPLITWFWTGGGLMVLGTALSAFPTRWSRRPTDPVSAAAVSAEA